MHTLCNMFEPTGRSLHQLKFGVFFTKALNINHKKFDDKGDDDDNDEDDDDENICALRSITVMMPLKSHD